jgi:acyl carrier protein
MQKTIRTFIVDNFLFGRQNGLTDNESLLEQGVIDSIGLLELISFLQKQYGIKVADEDLIPANLDSIDRIAGFVQRKLPCA